MAIFTVTSNAVENVDIFISSSFKAGMALMRDDNGRGVAADSQLLISKTIEQKFGKFLGFATSDHTSIANTIIIPDVIGSSYIDSSYNFIRTENNEIAVSKRAVNDYLNEGVNSFFNPSDSSVISKRGMAVYNQPNNIFITDQFKAVLHGDYGLDGLGTVALNPGDLLTFGGGINAGKLVKVNVNSFGPDILVVGIVEKYVASTNLLHFKQVNYSLSFGNYTSVFYDAANIVSYPGTGTTWSNLASTSYNMTLFNGPAYSSANNGVMVFDGADDYATSSGFSFTNFTMEMFVNVYQLTGTLAVNRIMETNSTYLTVVGSSFYGTLNALAPFDSTSGYVITSYIVPLGQYIHLTVVRNGTTYEIFVNGVSVYSASLGNATMTNLRLANGGGNENTRSSFGYFKIYNKVLTAAEVLNQYNFHKSRFGL
jgi:hypothetical protein